MANLTVYQYLELYQKPIPAKISQWQAENEANYVHFRIPKKEHQILLELLAKHNLTTGILIRTLIQLAHAERITIHNQLPLVSGSTRQTENRLRLVFKTSPTKINVQKKTWVNDNQSVPLL